jgi:hypothetical protein
VSEAPAAPPIERRARRGRTTPTLRQARAAAHTGLARADEHAGRAGAGAWMRKLASGGEAAANTPRQKKRRRPMELFLLACPPPRLRARRRRRPRLPTNRGREGQGMRGSARAWPKKRTDMVYACAWGGGKRVQGAGREKGVCVRAGASGQRDGSGGARAPLSLPQWRVLSPAPAPSCGDGRPPTPARPARLRQSQRPPLLRSRRLAR